MPIISLSLPTTLVRYVRPVVYVRFSATHIQAHVVGTDQVYQDVPALALRTNTRVIVAVGSDCAEAQALQGNSITVHHIFAHPRLLVADPALATALMRYVLSKLLPRWLPIKPYVIVHPQRSFPDSYSPLELQALGDVAKQAGGRTSYIWDGDVLTDDAMLSGCFPAGQWLGKIPSWSKDKAGIKDDKPARY